MSKVQLSIWEYSFHVREPLTKQAVTKERHKYKPKRKKYRELSECTVITITTFQRRVRLFALARGPPSSRYSTGRNDGNNKHTTRTHMQNDKRIKRARPFRRDAFQFPRNGSIDFVRANVARDCNRCTPSRNLARGKLCIEERGHGGDDGGGYFGLT